MVRDHNHLLTFSQIDPPRPRTSPAPVRQAFRLAFPSRSPPDTVYCYLLNVLLCDCDTKPDKRIRRTFLRPGRKARTSFYAAHRFDHLDAKREARPVMRCLT